MMKYNIVMCCYDKILVNVAAYVIPGSACVCVCVCACARARARVRAFFFFTPTPHTHTSNQELHFFYTCYMRSRR